MTSYWPDAQDVSEATFFDIGSVTKAVVTTTLFALAVDRKLVSLDQNLSHWVKEWKNAVCANMTLGDLLSHSAGLAAWYPIFETELPAVGIRSWIATHGAKWIEAPAGTKAQYSDLGFLLLGEVLREVWKSDLEKSFKQNVIEPLSLSEVRYGPIRGETVAATEVRQGKALVGVVFDENCQALGGKSSHAGLFATARGLVPWCREWLRAVHGKSRWLSQNTAQVFTTKSNRVTGSSWAFGWDTKSPKGSSAGQFFSESSFGHLGYPGCSVWLDPVRNGFAVFLTNRVHPSRLDERIRDVRPKLHDEIAKSWDV